MLRDISSGVMIDENEGTKVRARLTTMNKDVAAVTLGPTVHRKVYGKSQFTDGGFAFDLFGRAVAGIVVRSVPRQYEVVMSVWRER